MKGFAIFIIIAGVLVGMVTFMDGWTVYERNKDYIKYATVNGGNSWGSLEESGNKALDGRNQMNYGGIIVMGSLLTGLPLYGIGSILKTLRQMQETLNHIESLTNPQKTVTCPTETKTDIEIYQPPYRKDKSS